jgi:1-phosphofructokinase family hexose kinase
MTILCLNPNPALEHTWLVPGFLAETSGPAGFVAHVQESLVLAGGKGANAARGILRLGEAALACGALGGHTGRWLADLAQAEGIPARWVWIQGETRHAWALIDPEVPGREVALLSGDGPTLAADDWVRFIDDADQAVKAAGLACIAGSLPPGVPPDGLGTLIKQLHARGAAVWLDSSGTGLAQALEGELAGRPDGLKINAAEAAYLTGTAIPDAGTAFSAAQALGASGLREVVITLGAGGAVMLGPQGAWWVGAPVVPGAVSTVGSGDAFLAGLLVGRARRLPVPEMLRLAAACGGANTLLPGGGRFDPEVARGMLAQIEVCELK